MTRIAVIGDGAWGTALALLLHRAGRRVCVWSPFEAAAREILRSRRNDRFLPGVDLPEGIGWTADRGAAVADGEIVVWAVPSRFFRNTVRSFRSVLPESVLHVSGTKGLDPESLDRMSRVIEQELGTGPAVALSGPTFAAEVARGLPAAAVAACADAGRSRRTQEVFGGGTFRVYTSGDPVGVEMGGAVKNVIALAAGICEGIGAGSNARAALITRGLAETARLGTALGGRPGTFAGLSGLGDMVLTCTGPLSRNRRVGERIGSGERLQAVLDGMDQVAEGVGTCRSARVLAARAAVSMPIVDEVFAVLYEGKDPRQAVSDLMGRTLRAEPDGANPNGDGT